MKPLARWSLRQLDRAGLARSKPLLAPLLRTVWRYLRAPTPQAAEAAVQALALGRARPYPILFRDRHGLEYLLYPGENAEVYLANNGNYEVAETEFCLAHLRPGLTVFDVGANIGLYTLLFAQAVGPEGRVHAFEPEPRNFRRLQINLAINGCQNVRASQAAVFARSEPVTLEVFPEAANALHRLKSAAPAESGGAAAPEREAQVAGISLDDYCAEQNVARIDYLKIDVEGGELDVLRGAGRLLAEGAIGLVQFEALAASSSDIFELLRRAGFSCHPIATRGALGAEVQGYRPPYSNYAAVRA